MPWKLLCSIIPIFVALLFSGCASVATFSHRTAGQPLIYSGSRLDLEALLDKPDVTGKFAVKAPRYPALDLLPSMVLDTLALPATVPSALYLSIIE